MKKLLVPCLLAFSVLLPNVAGAQAVAAADAHKAIVKIHTYTSGLDGFLTDWQSGTGVIINSNGVILTNEHVISVQYGYDDSESTVGYQVCLTTDIAKEPDCAFTAKLIAADKDSDLALLQIVPIAGLSSMTAFPYIEPSKSGSVGVNQEVTALGYPAVGGDTISVSKGIVSGKQTKYGQDWIKIDAVTSFGSSGGALIDAAGKLVGVTTEVHSDLAATLGYAVDLNSVMPWIDAEKASSPIASALQDRVTAFTKRQRNRNASNTFQFEGYGFSIAKPSGWEFTYDSEDRLVVSSSADDEGGYVVVALARYDHPADSRFLDLMVKDDLATSGAIAQAKFTKNETVSLNGVPAKHVQVTGIENTVDEYLIENQDVIAQLFYGFGKNDKDASKINAVLNSVTKRSRTAPGLVRQLVNEKPMFSLKTNADWYIRKLDSKNSPFELYDKDFTSKVTIFIEKKTEQTRGLSNDDILGLKEKAVENAAAIVRNVNLGASVISRAAHAPLGAEAVDTVQYSVKDINLASGEAVLYLHSIIIPTADDYFSLTMTYHGSDRAQFDAKLVSLKRVLSTFSLSSTPRDPSTPADPAAEPAAPKPAPGAPFDRDAQRGAAPTINADKTLSSASVSGAASCVSNTLIKGRSSAAVYYCGANGKRFVFPDFRTYATWYDNFDGVITLTDEQLASIPIGGVVTYRPGTRMVKITSDPKVYAVGANGELRAIGSEAVAKRLYGSDWNRQIDDISDAFFVNYRAGDAINE